MNGVGIDSRWIPAAAAVSSAPDIASEERDGLGQRPHGALRDRIGGQDHLAGPGLAHRAQRGGDAVGRAGQRGRRRVVGALSGAAAETDEHAGAAGDPGAPALTGSADSIAAALREMGEAGADEVILVADPITERSVRTLAEAVALVG